MDLAPNLFAEPSRVSGCMNGSMFGASIMHMPNGRPRELVVYQQLYLGNIPSFLRTAVPVTVAANGHSGVFWTMPDYLAIGEDSDFLRMPMRPTTAQKAADRFNAVLPTRKMVRDVWRTSLLHLTPFPMDWRGAMASVSYFAEHNAHIQRQLAARATCYGVAGHKKDVVSCRGRPPKNVAICGWPNPDGTFIQELNAHSHDIPYLDYSHGVRLAHQVMQVDGGNRYVADVLQDPELWPLLSDEGMYSAADLRYPTEL